MNPFSGSEAIELANSRIFDAPREAVFEAFENPQHLMQWWGPEGFTNTLHEMDLRAGGMWRLTMHGPDGANYDNVSTFVEVMKPAKIVFHHLGPVHEYWMTMSYADAGAGRTKLTWNMAFAPSAGNEKLKSFLLSANEQNFDRLAACLGKLRKAR
jgi:uncharacterized protein YndB with AHSA1/START domain